MKYLVLQRFRSMGVTHLKGSVVDESLIRSPRIRQSEGKIVPAVSSFEVPAEDGLIGASSSSSSEEVRTPDPINDQEIDEEIDEENDEENDAENEEENDEAQPPKQGRKPSFGSFK